MKTIDNNFYKKIGIKIKQQREKKGYSLQTTVDKMNAYFVDNDIDRQYIRQTLSKIEFGKQRVDNEVFNALAFALEFSPDDLISSIRIDNAKPTTIGNSFIKIPILGKIPAGTPIEAIEDIIGYEEIPSQWSKNGDSFFALKIEGDSMLPDYKENDIIIVKQTNDCTSGDDCVVMVNGFDATFKKVIKEPDGIKLKPLNNDYETLKYTNEEIKKIPITILGIVKKQMRNH